MNNFFMKKSSLLCVGLCAALVLTGCKSKDSAYRKAYDKAKAAEAEATSGYGISRRTCLPWKGRPSCTEAEV